MAMAASPLLLPSLFTKPTLLAAPLRRSLPRTRHLRCSPNGAAVLESPKPAPRRGHKKSSSPWPPKAKGKRRRTKKTEQDSDSEGEEEPAKRTSRRARKSKQAAKREEEEAQTENRAAEDPKREADEEDGEEVGSGYDDGVDLPYEWPPLVCCFGAPRWEFVPTVRVSDRQMHPDQYSTWRHLQWEPPEFARAPGSAASNVASALTRLGASAAAPRCSARSATTTSAASWSTA